MFKKVKQQKVCLRESGDIGCPLFGFIGCFSWRLEPLHFSGLVAPPSCEVFVDTELQESPPPPPFFAGHLHSECLCEWHVRCPSKGLHKFLG